MSGALPPPDPAHRNQYLAEPRPAGGGEYDRLRRVLIPVAGFAMVVFAIGLGAFVLRDHGDSNRPTGVFGAAPAATSSPPPTANPTTAPNAASSTAAAGVAPTTAAAAPGTNSPAPTTATTVPAGTSTTAPNGSTSAVETAQALLNALADGRWSDVRVLNPGRNETDAFLESRYGALEQATIVPAKITPVSDGRFDLRFGIVAHEAQPTGQQTVLMCSHWQVDVPTKTILRISSARIRVEGGYVQPAPLAAELSSTCQSVPAK